jgi:hypothetical protein
MRLKAKHELCGFFEGAITMLTLAAVGCAVGSVIIWALR